MSRLNEVVGKPLVTFEGPVRPRFRKWSKMLLVIDAVVDTLPTLLTTAPSAA